MTPILALCFWELSLAALCYCAVASVRDRRQRLALLLALDIPVAALLASGASFLRINSPAFYLTAAAVMAVCAAAAFWRVQTRFAAPHGRGTALHVALASVFSLVAVLSFTPLREPDSLFNLHFVFGWLDNRTTPYTFAFHYVPFWELSYLPVLSLTGNDVYFWFQSAKPIVLLGAILLLIADELELPASLAALSVAASLLFPNLWFHLSGLATLKNDMLAASGQAILGLIAIRAVRGRLSLPDWSLFAFALCFVSAKFSGPVLIVAGSLVALPLVWRHLKGLAPIGCAVAALYLITVGHYYVHNLVVFGNPFYPFQINLGPLHLPGLGDLSNTSILYSLRAPDVWRAFFWPANGLSPAGALFPLIFAAMIGVSVFYCAKAAVARLRGGVWLSVNFVVSLFLLVVLAVYLRSVYSASGNAGDLAFVRYDLNSVRYVAGALMVAEVFFVSLLLRSGWPRPLIVSLIAIHGLSRLAILIRKWSEAPTAAPAAIIGWTLLLICAVSTFIILRGPRWKALGLAATLAVLLAASGSLLEQQRAQWLPQWSPLFQPLYRGAPERVFLVVDDEYSAQGCAHLPLRGARLKNAVQTGSLPELAAIVKEGANLPPRVLWIKRGAGAAPALMDAHYEKAVESPAGILYALRR